MVPGYSFELPWAHLLLTPFCSVADTLTVLSIHRLIGVLVIALGGIVAFTQTWKMRIGLFLALIGFIVWTAVAPRPTARLLTRDTDVLLLDFHSHTSRSHDGRPSFSPARNNLWHARQGYGAGFVTDHNRLDGALEAKEASRQTGYRAFLGEEVSLLNTHLIVLGLQEVLDPKPYDSDPKKVPLFIRDMKKKGYLVIASLPEYWEHHWPAGIQEFVSAGISGFEIISGAPKALDFPLQKRNEIVSLCREKGLFVTGISDNHGYGNATPAWNAMRIPNWLAMDPDGLEKAVLDNLKKGGFSTVQVLERDRQLWRTVQPQQAAFWLVWIWMIWGVGRIFNGRKI